MHPLWHLLPLLICTTVLSGLVYFTLDDAHKDALPTNRIHLAWIALGHALAAAGASISLWPVLAWTVGRFG